MKTLLLTALLLIGSVAHADIMARQGDTIYSDSPTHVILTCRQSGTDQDKCWMPLPSLAITPQQFARQSGYSNIYSVSIHFEHEIVFYVVEVSK